MEICFECGQEVSWGSGRYINRVVDLDTLEERKIAGKRFPEGDFICAECVERHSKETFNFHNVKGGTNDNT